MKVGLAAFLTHEQDTQNYDRDPDKNVLTRSGSRITDANCERVTRII